MNSARPTCLAVALVAAFFLSCSVHLTAADTPSDGAAINTLADSEKAAGWKLLFDGKSTDGWHNYRKHDIGPGWQVVDGTLACVDTKRSGGDLVTDEKFDNFELVLEYNISKGGNSGVMFHVTDEGPTTWATGPEVQLFDNQQTGSHEEQLSGWLYQLYKPPVDPATGKPRDSTHPAGEWNDVRIIIAPEKCEVYMNGDKYYEFVLGSDDWNQRVAKSKFASMPGFGKAASGRIALQGDHGAVSFRNIKIRPIAAER
jgi:Domain of Unknown Function (DUF1080)